MSGQNTTGHLHNGILLGCKKEVLPFATVWMDLENTMLSEISQWEEDKYHMIFLIWYLSSLGGGGIEQKGKRTHGHGQQCGDCGAGVIWGLNGNKNTIKIIKRKRTICALHQFCKNSSPRKMHSFPVRHKLFPAYINWKYYVHVSLRLFSFWGHSKQH